MNHTLFLNFAIILLTAAGLLFTDNPMVLLCLFFLQELPVHVVTNEQQIRAKLLENGPDDEDEDEGESAIGFTASIK